MNTTKIEKIFNNTEFKYPDKLIKEDYERARQVIIENYKEVVGLVAIYEFGKLNVPGISDLDLIFVFEDDLDDVGAGVDFSRKELADNVQDILCGSTLMVISEQNFMNILIWDDLVLNHIYGKHILINDIGDLNRLRNIIQIMDWLPERILSIKKQLSSGKLPIIRFLGLLHSLNYTFDKAILVGAILPKDATKYVDHIRSTTIARELFLSYGDMQSREVLASLTKQAFTLGYEALEIVAKFMNENRYYSPDKNSFMGGFSLAKDFGYEFSDTNKSLMELNLVKFPEINIIIVPAEWGIHWKTYGEINGTVSKKIKNAFSHSENIGGNMNPKIRKFLYRRITHCDSMANFLNRNGFSKGLYKFGWFY